MAAGQGEMHDLTAKNPPAAQLPQAWQENLARIEELSLRLAKAYARKREVSPRLSGPEPELWLRGLAGMTAEFLAEPERILQLQQEWLAESAKNVAAAQKNFAAQQAGADGSADARFADPAWEANPWFRYLRDQYLLSAKIVQKTIAEMDGISEIDRKRLAYFSAQIVNALSPANFLLTNPEALRKALQTQGLSLVRGLENLVRDLEANRGEPVVSLTDSSAFGLGENIAVTPGSVVFRNRMMELIQYAPASEKVFQTPLLIFPPWINKYYILDLTPKNSMVRWLTEQGFTVFIVSWVNPDASYADVGLETYVQEGYLKAIQVVREICAVRKINVAGYCIGGTTLALTLALMQKRALPWVKSATFLTTLTDFSDQGEFTAFLQDDFVTGIEAEIRKSGVLEAFYMARTFSFLRANDLIWRPAVQRYLLGEPPPRFDLLFWNADSTNLPGRMTMQYLRALCQDNLFAAESFPMLGEDLSVRDVKLPLCAVACESDHIAPWRASYDGIRRMGSPDKTFILSESGHIAGIVNPPAKRKYGHYTNPDFPCISEDWLHDARFQEGSWWPRWKAWLARHSGRMIPARAPGSSEHPPLMDAPGSYVRRPATL